MRLSKGQGANKAPFATHPPDLEKEIREHFYILEKRSDDIVQLEKQFKEGYNVWSQIQKDVKNIQNAEDLVREIIKHLNTLGLHISRQSVEEIATSARILKSLTPNREIAYSPVLSTKGLGNSMAFLQDSEQIYRFFSKLYELLSSYKIQNNLTQYRYVDTTALHTNTKLKLSSNRELDYFFTRVGLDAGDRSEYNVLYRRVKDLEMDEEKLITLDKVLKKAFDQVITLECPKNPDHMEVRGEFVKLSDVIDERVTGCNHKINTLQIVALNRVFFNIDIIKTGEKFKLSIVAPTWEIVGDRRIVLDGSDGEAHKEAKARDGMGPGQDGAQGKPGNPGKPGGRFFGIGKIFLNSKKLQISSFGGKGGLGQNGGDGKDGKEGKDATKARTKDPTEIWKQEGFTVISHFIDEYRDQYSSSVIYRHMVCGIPATNGGNGGNGGAGGKGGYGGNIQVIALGKGFESIFGNNNGTYGKPGNGGKGANGAKHGETLTTECSTIYALFTHSTGCTKNSWEENGFSDKGKAGLTGGNKEHPSNPESPPEFSNIAFNVNNFKNYLRENLEDNIREVELKEFLDELEKDPSVTNLYNTLGLVNEVIGLENQFFRLKTHVSLLPFYDSLLKRITKYADNRKPTENTLQIKKVLNKLYSVILSKICNYQNELKSDLVINIEAALKLSINAIKQLKKVANNVAINEYQKAYNQSINEKIQEANNFITNEVSPEIDQVTKKIEDKIEDLVKQTLDLIREGEKEKENLINAEVELENSLVFRQILGPMKIATQFLNFLGPVGTATGAALGGGLSIAEQFALSDPDTSVLENLGKVPKAVKDALEKVSGEILTHKQQLFDKQLDDAQKQLDEYIDKKKPGPSLEQLREKIKNTRQQLKEEMDKGATLDPGSLQKIRTLRDQLTDELKKQKEAVEEDKRTLDEDKNAQKKVVANIQNLINIADVSLQVYNDIRKHQDKINKLGESIAKANKKLESLKKYEENIYKIMLPAINGLANKAKDIESKLRGKSHVGLDIDKWRIQGTIRDVKSQMRQMTKDFAIQDELSRAIERLEEGMTVLINVYDRIQDFYDQAQLGAFISDVVSDNSLKIRVDDPDLKRALDICDLIVKSNMVLGHYERSINSFQQYIFPLANDFLDKFNLPENLQLGNGTDALVSQAIFKLEALEEDLSESKIKINKYDEFKFDGAEFSHKNRVLHPFMVWNGPENRDTIVRLLSGYEIAVKADVLQEKNNKNAIKFNVVGINFKPSDNTISQQKIDDILLSYEVKITHQGNSYYRCGTKFYVIFSQKQPITYSFQMKKTDSGYPVKTNGVYDKLRSGNLLLSPYTMWTIQIVNTDKNYKPLSKLIDHVDLELEGIGGYYEQGEFNTIVCSRNLDRYYKHDPSISEMNEVNLTQKANLHVDLRLMEYGYPRLSAHMKRKRRNLNADDVPSSAQSNSASPINNLFNWLGSGLATLKVLTSSVNPRVDWFSPTPAEVPFKYLDKIGISKSSFPGHALQNTPTPDLFSALTFANFMIRSYVTGKKYNTMSYKNNIKEHNMNSNHAQHLAYSYYAPEQCDFKNEKKNFVSYDSDQIISGNILPVTGQIMNQVSANTSNILGKNILNVNLIN